MPVTSSAGIESVLQQMRAAVQVAQGKVGSSAELAPSQAGSFVSEFQQALQRVSQAQNASNNQAKAFEMGTPGVELSKVMIDLQTAHIGFQTVVQLRNKLVAAYKEISTMPV